MDLALSGKKKHFNLGKSVNTLYKGLNWPDLNTIGFSSIWM